MFIPWKDPIGMAGLALFYLIILCGWFTWIEERPALFSPLDIRTWARESVERKFEVTEAYSYLLEKMQKAHPDHEMANSPWLLSYSGGAVETYKILYASMSEYVILVGSPVSTQGFSGRHWGIKLSTILKGKVSQVKEGATKAVVHAEGHTMDVDRFQASSYSMAANTWRVEYAKACVPAMSLYGLSDLLLAGDVLAAAKAVFHYGYPAFREFAYNGKI